MKYCEFTNPNNWIGGFYELSIEYHPVGNNQRMNDALVSLQRCHFFKGIWEDLNDFQVNTITLPIKIEEDSVSQFYGTLSLLDGVTLPCVVTAIRTNEESDWLDISIPQALLERNFPYKYPLTKELNPWLERVDEMLIKLAEFINNDSPFNLAIIGEEVSGYTNQENITAKCLNKMTFILPFDLQKRLGVEDKGEELSNQLRLFKQHYFS